MRRKSALLTLLAASVLLAGCTIQPAVPVTQPGGATGAVTTTGAAGETTIVTSTVTSASEASASEASASEASPSEASPSNATVEGENAVTTTTSVVTTTVTTVTAGVAVSETAALTVPDTAGDGATVDASLLPTPTLAAPLTGTEAVTSPAPVTATAAATAVVTDTASGTLLQVINSTPGLETLSAALVASGMAAGLDAPGPLTLFAPNNDAFASLPAGQVDALLADPATLASILQYHIVIDNVSQTGLGTLGAALSSSGLPITVTVQADGSLLINEAALVQGDIAASNGVIHIIDGVLTPPAATTP